MLLSWWITELLLLLLLLLLPAGTQGQSGDGDEEPERRISCTSHISTEEGSLTCRLAAGGGHVDDDEDEDDGVESMTACYNDLQLGRFRCLREAGDTLTSSDLKPLIQFHVTVHLKRGRNITTTVDLMKIVKPRAPWVSNVTFNRESNQAVIYIRTLYQNEYLKVDNQLFQLQIWTSSAKMIQNVSSSDRMDVDLEHLQKNAQYHVRVRAIPLNILQGSWSEWSNTFNFSTPADANTHQDDKQQETVYKLIVCLVSFVVLPSTVVLFKKYKILAHMWPSIPHPKATLVQVCKPSKGLLNLKPEEFSALKIYSMEKTDMQSCEETELPTRPAAADHSRSPQLGSTQSSDFCRSNASISTEELELSGLLSSNRDQSLQSRSNQDQSLETGFNQDHSLQSRSNQDQMLDTGFKSDQSLQSESNQDQSLETGSNQDQSLPSCSSTPTDIAWFRDGAEPGPGCSGDAEEFRAHQKEEAYVTMSSFYQIKKTPDPHQV